MADRYWVGGTGNWSDDDGHWATSSGGSPGDGNLPTASDDVYIDDTSYSGGLIITVNIIANCNNLNSIGLSAKTCVLNWVSYTNYLYISGSININSKLSVSGNYPAFTCVATSEQTITLGSAKSNLDLSFNGIGGKWVFQDATNTIRSIGITNGEVDLNSKIFTVPSIICFSGTILTCGSATMNSVSGNIALYNGSTFNAGTSTFNFSGAHVGLQILNNAEFYNITISGSSTEYNMYVYGMPYLYDCILRVTNDLTITGYDRKRIMLIYAYGEIGQNSGYAWKFIINADNITCLNVAFLGITFEGSGDYDFSSNDTIGDCGLNTGATFISPINAYYYQDTGNFCDAKWYTETNGGGSSCRIPLPQDNAIFDSNSFTTPSTISIDTWLIGGLDTSDSSQDISLILLTPMPNFYYFLVAKSFDLSNVVSFTGISGLFYFDFIGSSKSVNLNDLVISSSTILFHANNGVIIDLTGGFTTTNTVSGVQKESSSCVKFNSHTYHINQIQFYTQQVDLGSSEIYITGGGYLGASSAALAGSSKIYLNPISSSGMAFGAASSRGTYYYIEISGNTTGYVTFSHEFTLDTLKIYPGMKVKFYGKYYQYWRQNYFNTLIINGELGNLITLRGNLASGFLQFLLIKQTSGIVEAEYVDIQDCNLTGVASIKKVESVAIANVKQTLGIVKANLKRIMGTFLSGGGIAMHSIDNGNNSGWIITP